jgi:hypothetical protein
MGCTLAELGRRMTSAEFALHMQLEIERQSSGKKAEPESDWCDGM